MKTTFIVYISFIGILYTSFKANGQAPVKTEAMSADTKAKSDQEQENKAASWIATLNLNDADKEARLKEVVATHLKAIRNWSNDHPYTTVPAGINPTSGNMLSNLDRQVIANSAMPKEIHEALMLGLRKDLTEIQVEAILDKYTVGKVAFTMNGYKAIVPNLTKEEEDKILGYLKQAREQAVDYKNMKQISAIFEIYKTKCEQFLNSNGRSWKALYKTYTDSIKAAKQIK